MFDKIEIAPPDPILGLDEAFKSDPNPTKINLGVGVYKDERGNTPIFSAVKRAEAAILQSETSKSYLGIIGAPEYAAAVQGLLFGANHPVMAARRAVTAHCPGGTGALRVAADFIKRVNPGAHVWISRPTWPNHPGVMAAAGLAVEIYPYFDATDNRVAFAEMQAALATRVCGRCGGAAWQLPQSYRRGSYTRAVGDPCGSPGRAWVAAAYRFRLSGFWLWIGRGCPRAAHPVRPVG